mmetsp:Transcript_13767/g.15476  ORF Transcript_13767/g.15476 Transcript_13767/m.15476 type:complete len:205 (-) Transcript_13767:938-1552(-)
MKTSFLLLILPTQIFGFAPCSTETFLAKHALVKSSQGILFSSFSDENPMSLELEEDSDFDNYQPGQKEIAFKDLMVGDGDIIAEAWDAMTVSFVGKVLSSGSQFAANEAFTFEIGEGKSFPGFEDALTGTRSGAKRLIRVPPGRAYGTRGTKGIPPNADLEFECEVKSVARGQFSVAMEKVGYDRAFGFAVMFLILALSPFLPS